MKRLTIAALIAVLSGSPLFAQTQSTREKTIEDVAAISETLVESALAGSASKVNDASSGIDLALPKLRTALSPATFTAVEARLREQKAAVAIGRPSAIALPSIELYRLLEEAKDPRTRLTPVQVSLLDYSGFKIAALAGDGTVDWRTVDGAVTEAAAFWKPLEAQVKSAALRTLMTSILRGLKSASASKNAKWAASTAQVLLDSVDLLEGQFTAR